MTLYEAKKQSAIERQILGLVHGLLNQPDMRLRIDFQVARIAALESYIIATMLAADRPEPEWEQPPVREPAPLLEPTPPPWPLDRTSNMPDQYRGTSPPWPSEHHHPVFP
jgi:hypothetical protein